MLNVKFGNLEMESGDAAAGLRRYTAAQVVLDQLNAADANNGSTPRLSV